MSRNRALADRVAALERQVASLLTPPKPAAPPPVQGRVSKKQAAAALACSTRQVERFVARGLLALLPKPAGAAGNVRTYFHPDNVAALARSEDDARLWVANRKYANRSKSR